MSKKIYDLCVAVGKYQKDGQEKNRYENVGSIFQKDDNGKFIILKRTFSPAGVPNPDNKDSVILSMFAVKDDADKVSETFSGETAKDAADFDSAKIPF